MKTDRKSRVVNQNVPKVKDFSKGLTRDEEAIAEYQEQRATGKAALSQSV